MEVATTLGALFGAYLTATISGNWIGIVFGVARLYSAWSSLRKTEMERKVSEPDALATRLASASCLLLARCRAA